MTAAGDLATFEALFGPPVTRVDLDWDLLRRHAPRIALLATASLSEIERWHAPWYRHRDGTEATHATSDLPPVTFAQVRQDVERDPPCGRAVRIRDIADDLRQRRPSVLLVAGYELGDGRRLVLDGNHRLAALVAAQLHGWRVALLSVAGPIDPEVLPDLRHFTR